MAQITLKTPTGADAGSVELDDAVFGIQPNVPVMHQVVTAQLANRRAGTQSTKTRSEVRGGGAKPYRQKGTGNARQGSTNAPHYTGGGIALGPKPRGYTQRTPKKMIKLATRSALSDRASEGKVVVIDRWAFDAPKTKDAKAALSSLGVEGRTARRHRLLGVAHRPLVPQPPRGAADQGRRAQRLRHPVQRLDRLRAGPPADGAGADRPATAAVAEPEDRDRRRPRRGPRRRGRTSPRRRRQPDGFPIKGNANSMLYHLPARRLRQRSPR